MEKRKRKVSAVERIKNSIVMVDRDDNTLSIDFKDKGLKIDVTDDYAVITTMYHKHVFDAMTANGISETYSFIKQFVEIALEKDCVKAYDDGVEYYSYQELDKLMKTNEVSETERIIFMVCDMWFYNIFQPIYTLRADQISSFIVYMNYLSNLTNTHILLKESKKDITNVEYIKEYIYYIKLLF